MSSSELRHMQGSSPAVAATAAQLHSTAGSFSLAGPGNPSLNLATKGDEMSTLNMPGFTAEFALSTTGRGYLVIANALTHDSHASVSLARTKVSGPGGTQCELDATLTVEDEGGTSTTNIWKCTTTVGMGDGGSGTQGSSGDQSDGGGGGGTRPTPTQKPPRPRRGWPPDLGEGPNRNQIPDYFKCEGGWLPADLEVCHACSDTPSGVRCTCYDCQRSSGLCTRAYDCTDTYGQTG